MIRPENCEHRRTQVISDDEEEYVLICEGCSSTRVFWKLKNTWSEWLRP